MSTNLNYCFDCDKPIKNTGYICKSCTQAFIENKILIDRAKYSSKKKEAVKEKVI
tara:strand:+ start:1597 stop:1761 length:165 start_codon:yes stop_codon:yes gene_type:complete